MDTGEICPRCQKSDKTQLLSTTNEWCNYCARCDIRFNDLNEIKPDRP